MADCFISYSKYDTDFVNPIVEELRRNGVKPFIAPTSIEYGRKWNDSIADAMQDCDWVLYMASQSSVESPYVQQEVGAAIFGGKTLIPIVWDMSPSELPGWAKDYQAIDLRGKSQEEIAHQIKALSGKIPTEVGWGEVLAGALAIGVAAAVGKAVVGDART